MLWLRVGTGGVPAGDVGEVGDKLFIDLVVMWWELFVLRGFAIRLANDCELLDMWSSATYLLLCVVRAEEVDFELPWVASRDTPGREVEEGDAPFVWDGTTTPR